MNRSKADKNYHPLLTVRQRGHFERIRAEYEANPKTCPLCGKALTYAQRHNTYGSRSCSVVIFNTTVRKHHEECAHCGEIKETRENKYCNRCINNNVYSNRITNLAAAKSDRIRRKLLIGQRGHQCEDCGYAKWNGRPMPLELDHIDGNSDHNAPENWRVVCPNCHACTDHYKGANMGKNAGNDTKMV